MPKRKAPEVEATKKRPTSEALSWVRGLYDEFADQVVRYHELTAHLLSLQARVELVEKNLCVTRDHLALQIEKAEEGMPAAWSEKLTLTRFVGMRLSDACIELLRQHKHLTHVEMLNALNMGMFRFRTNAPGREIHGALLRQPDIKRVSDGWLWTGPDIVEVEPMPQPTTDGQAGLQLVSRAKPN